MPVRSCSGSGPGSTRNTCGTGMHSMPLVGWRAIITPKSCGLRKNNEQAHAGISDRGSAADGGGTGRVREEFGAAASRRTAAGRPHQVLQLWGERPRGEFLRRRNEDDGDPVRDGGGTQYGRGVRRRGKWRGLLADRGGARNGGREGPGGGRQKTRQCHRYDDPTRTEIRLRLFEGGFQMHRE